VSRKKSIGRSLHKVLEQEDPVEWLEKEAIRQYTDIKEFSSRRMKRLVLKAIQVHRLDQDDNTSIVTDSVVVNPANIKDSVLYGTKGKGREEPIQAGRADTTIQAATSELPERSSFRVASFASYNLPEQVHSATDIAFKKRQEDPCMHEAEPSKLQHAD
jgi:hypothetical protein